VDCACAGNYSLRCYYQINIDINFVSRQKKNPVLLAQMCLRLTAVMDLLGASDARMSAMLGYANAATLSQVRRGSTFPDVEKLVSLGQMTVGGGAMPNLHWLLTGVGSAFLPVDPDSSVSRSASQALSQVALMNRGDSGASVTRASKPRRRSSPKLR